MFIRTALALTAATFAVATPASAVTFLMGGASGTPTGATRTAEGITLNMAPRHFTVTPSALTNIAQLSSSGQLSVSSLGMGVNGGASAPQIDTNTTNAREALYVSASRALSLTGLKLSMVDANDTLAIYGVGPGGALTSLGFDGLIRTGLAGAASYTHGSANGGTTTLAFNDASAMFDAFLFTTRIGGETLFSGERGQGYRIESISAGVPEPATWAMLILGFGLIGASLRRRQTTHLPIEA